MKAFCAFRLDSINERNQLLLLPQAFDVYLVERADRLVTHGSIFGEAIQIITESGVGIRANSVPDVMSLVNDLQISNQFSLINRSRSIQVCNYVGTACPWVRSLCRQILPIEKRGFASSLLSSIACMTMGDSEQLRTSGSPWQRMAHG